MDIGTILFGTVILILAILFIKQAYSATKTPDINDYIPINESEPWKLCEAFHRNVWKRLHQPMELEEVRGDNNPKQYWWLCPVCERYR